jgi:hypothetical protein
LRSGAKRPSFSRRSLSFRKATSSAPRPHARDVDLVVALLLEDADVAAHLDLDAVADVAAEAARG